MRRAVSLSLLLEHAERKLDRFNRRVNLIRNGVDDLNRALDLHQTEVELGSLVINLQSYWSNWCRAFYMSVSLGTVSSTGLAISSTIPLTTEHDALTVAIKGKLVASAPWPSYREPKWFSPPDLAAVIFNANINSGALIVAILNSAPVGISSLRTMRNYFGHRSESLKQDALALGPAYLVSSPKKPSEILLFVEPGRTVSVLERWIMDLRRTSRALAH